MRKFIDVLQKFKFYYVFYLNSFNTEQQINLSENFVLSKCSTQRKPAEFWIEVKDKK